MRMFHGLLLMIGGLYAPYFYAGNGNIVAKKSEEEEKKIVTIQPIYKKQECVRCKNEAKETTNPLWSPCNKKAKFLHNMAKTASVFEMIGFNPNCQLVRDKYGVIPLSKAIFRARKEGERYRSCMMVEEIMKSVGKHALNMLLLRDHCGCSVWMHAIYMGDPLVVGTIMVRIKEQVEDPQAVWKLLTHQDSAAKDLRHRGRKLTALMVAVSRKNVELIKLLKVLAGDKFQEYCLMKSGWGDTASRFIDKNDEILKLLLL